MKVLLSSIIASVYIAFTIGITLHIHQCSDGNTDSEIVIASSTDHCESEAAHACCSEPAQKACCEQSSAGDDCCYDGEVYIQLEQPQVVSKSMLIFALPDFSQNISNNLVDLYTEDSIQNEVISHPPPIIEEKHILYCSFTFYG